MALMTLFANRRSRGSTSYAEVVFLVPEGSQEIPLRYAPARKAAPITAKVRVEMGQAGTLPSNARRFQVRSLDS